MSNQLTEDVNSTSTQPAEKQPAETLKLLQDRQLQVTHEHRLVLANNSLVPLRPNATHLNNSGTGMRHRAQPSQPSRVTRAACCSTRLEDTALLRAGSSCRLLLSAPPAVLLAQLRCIFSTPLSSFPLCCRSPTGPRSPSTDGLHPSVGAGDSELHQLGSHWALASKGL